MFDSRHFSKEKDLSLSRVNNAYSRMDQSDHILMDKKLQEIKQIIKELTSEFKMTIMKNRNPSWDSR